MVDVREKAADTQFEEHESGQFKHKETQKANPKRQKESVTEDEDSYSEEEEMQRIVKAKRGGRA